MCEFASGWVHKDGRILVGNLRSHNGVEDGYGFSAVDAREWEWTGEHISDLHVRTYNKNNVAVLVDGLHKK